MKAMPRGQQGGAVGRQFDGFELEYSTAGGREISNERRILTAWVECR
jgi:hypothetical protein